MVARWTADTIMESLYHCLIQLKCLPFLPDELHTKECLELHSVKEVMSGPAVTLPLFGPVADVARALTESRHSAFPVVEPGLQGGDVFKVRSCVCVLKAHPSPMPTNVRRLALCSLPSFTD